MQPSDRKRKVDDTDNLNTQASRVIAAALKHQPFQDSYYTLKNLNTAAIHKGFDVWARAMKLSHAAAETYRAQIHIRKAQEFRGGVQQGVLWLAHKLHTLSTRRRFKPYAMLVEVDKTAHTAKSSAWLAGPVIQGLGVYGVPPPTVLIPVVGRKIQSLRYLREALRLGVTTFVHVDDAIYSGEQKHGMLAGLLSMLRQEKAPPSRMYLATAYATTDGLAHVEKATVPLVLDVSVFAALKIPIRTAPVNGNGGPTMTILPHIVPDVKSFGPELLGNKLRSIAPQPPYKKFKYYKNKNSFQ